MEKDRTKLELLENQLFFTVDNADSLRTYLTPENMDRLKSLTPIEAEVVLDWASGLRETYAKVLQGLEYFEAVLHEASTSSGR